MEPDILMISIDLSETAHFVHWKSETTSERKIFSDNFFFLTKYIFHRLNFVSDFVSDYIPQLYFVCNHLIKYWWCYHP